VQGRLPLGQRWFIKSTPLEGRVAPPPWWWCLLGDLCLLCVFWLVTCQWDASYLRFRGVTKCPTQACTMPPLTLMAPSNPTITALFVVDGTRKVCLRGASMFTVVRMSAEFGHHIKELQWNCLSMEDLYEPRLVIIHDCGDRQMLEILFTTSASTRVLALVVKRTSSKSVERRFESSSPVTPSLRSWGFYLLTMLMSRYKVSPLGYDKLNKLPGPGTPTLAEEPSFYTFARSFFYH
jgi:hypothetical protein